MSSPLRTVAGLVLLVFLATAGSAAKNLPWEPVPADELAYTGPPKTGPDSAVVLFRSHHIDDQADIETHHWRVKVLKQEGMKWADVQIAFVKDWHKIEDIQARAVEPNGSATEFTGTVYDKLVVRRRRTKVLVKAFTVPNVKVGSIIEYRYRIRGAFRRSWSLQHELHTRRSTYYLRPYEGSPFYYSSFTFFTGKPGLFWIYYTPNNQKLTRLKNGDVTLDLADVPAVQEEPYSPPEDEIRMRVDFFYSWQNFLNRPDEFWDQISKYLWPHWEKFVDRKKALQRELATIVAPNDSPEDKLRKIYQRVQQVRNLSFERDKTEKEEKREKLKSNDHVEHVLERGYGDGDDINLLFMALARAAGFEASMVMLAARDQRFFAKELVDIRQLTARVIAVKIGDQDRYFDPATKYCAYGQLPWAETGADGFKVGKEKATFIRTPVPGPEEAMTRRVAELRLTETGDLEGSVKVYYNGQEALRRRLEFRHEDEVKRREELEDELKQMVLSSAEVKLEKMTGWDETGTPLVAEFTLRVPEFAVSTGKRLLLESSPLGARRTQPFSVTERIHPVYFEYPFLEQEEVAIHLPGGYRLETLPQPRKIMNQWESFENSFNAEENVVRATRKVAIKGLLYPVNYYPQLRAFFDGIRAADADKLVLQTAQAARQ